MLQNKRLLYILYNTFHASLTEEYQQRDVITSELGICVLQTTFGHYETTVVSNAHKWFYICHMFYWFLYNSKQNIMNV